MIIIPGRSQRAPMGATRGTDFGAATSQICRVRPADAGIARDYVPLAILMGKSSGARDAERVGAARTRDAATRL